MITVFFNLIVIKLQRITYIEKTLQTGLERLFKEGLTNKNDNIISNCLRTYAAIDKLSEPEYLYRKWFVSPVTQKIITIENLDRDSTTSTPTPNNPNQSSSKGLTNIYKQLIEYIKTECMYLIELTHKSLRGYNFLV